MNIPTKTAVLLSILSILFGMQLHKEGISLDRLLGSVLFDSVQVQTSPTTSVRTEERIDPLYEMTDIDSLIRIRTREAVEQRRDDLRRFLWGASRVPTHVEITDLGPANGHPFEEIQSLASVRRFEVEMEFGLNSIVYQFVPENSNGEIVLYHQGHRGGVELGIETIRAILEEGYTVLAFAMPLIGENERPVVRLDRFGYVRISNHDKLKLLRPEQGHPIKYLIEPVIVVLDHLPDIRAAQRISMIGVSGGGWTTHLVAAIEPRVKLSFPVAGSYPIYLRSGPRRDWGDYEQTQPSLYSVANYLELYLLGAAGHERQQLQVLNVFDPCCFAGKDWVKYEPAVRDAVMRVGEGKFEVLFDDSHSEHDISDAALRVFLDRLDAT